MEIDIGKAWEIFLTKVRNLPSASIKKIEDASTAIKKWREAKAEKKSLTESGENFHWGKFLIKSFAIPLTLIALVVVGSMLAVGLETIQPYISGLYRPDVVISAVLSLLTTSVILFFWRRRSGKDLSEKDARVHIPKVPVRRPTPDAEFARKPLELVPKDPTPPKVSEPIIETIDVKETKKVTEEVTGKALKDSNSSEKSASFTHAKRKTVRGKSISGGAILTAIAVGIILVLLGDMFRWDFMRVIGMIFFLLLFLYSIARVLTSKAKGAFGALAALALLFLIILGIFTFGDDSPEIAVEKPTAPVVVFDTVTVEVKEELESVISTEVEAIETSKIVTQVISDCVDNEIYTITENSPLRLLVKGLNWKVFTHEMVGGYRLRFPTSSDDLIVERPVNSGFYDHPIDPDVVEIHVREVDPLVMRVTISGCTSVTHPLEP